MAGGDEDRNGTVAASLDSGVNSTPKKVDNIPKPTIDEGDKKSDEEKLKTRELINAWAKKGYLKTGKDREGF